MGKIAVPADVKKAELAQSYIHHPVMAFLFSGSRDSIESLFLFLNKFLNID